MELNLFSNVSSNSFARKQKVKLFLIFVTISFLFWGITKFSKNYSALVFFNVKYENTPDLMIIKSNYKTIEGYINSSGFQLLLYRLMPKTLKVDISIANFDNSKGVIDLIPQRRALDDQIIGNFLSFENDQLFFNYYTFKTKKIKVKANTEFNYMSGFGGINDFKITPDSVVVSGPKATLEKLEFLNTQLIEKDNISKDINLLALIENNDSLLKISPNKVFISRSVKQYTEQEFEVYIKVVNLPDSIEIKLFPEKVKLTSSLPIQFIEKVEDKDFELVFNYSTTENGKFEAKKAGELIKDTKINIDHYYSSIQIRAKNTLKLIQEVLKDNKVSKKVWQLNERHYGALTGLNKDEMKAKLGEEKIYQFRRSWDLRPAALHPCSGSQTWRAQEWRAL